MEWKDLTSKRVSAARDAYANFLKSKLGQGASAYPGAVTSTPDPMTLMAAQIMMGLQGGQYKPPQFLGAQGMPGYGGGGMSAGSSAGINPALMSGLRSDQYKNNGQNPNDPASWEPGSYYKSISKWMLKNPKK